MADWCPWLHPANAREEILTSEKQKGKNANPSIETECMASIGELEGLNSKKKKTELIYSLGRQDVTVDRNASNQTLCNMNPDISE